MRRGLWHGQDYAVQVHDLRKKRAESDFIFEREHQRENGESVRESMRMRLSWQGRPERARDVDADSDADLGSSRASTNFLVEKLPAAFPACDPLNKLPKACRR